MGLQKIKNIILKIIRYILRVFMKLLPLPLKVNLVAEIAGSAIDGNKPLDKLRFLLELDNRLYPMQGKAAREHGSGIHTKHKHLNYHNFFIANIHPGERLLDIGSGNGLMDYKLVRKVPDLKVVGIDNNQANISFARAHYDHPNLTFIQGNVYHDLPDQKFDVVILSNVLEHFQDRVGLLRMIVAKVEPQRLIIRVPSFERDWRVPLKEEIGLDYRLDSTHFIEYTLESFQEEMQRAGLKIDHIEVRWGEIWSMAEVS